MKRLNPINPMDHPKNFIEMIKALRCLAKVLGKFGINSMYHVNYMWEEERKYAALHNLPPSFTYDKYSYGIGLKEAKDWTERYLSRKAASTYA
jgi:hypothetical protein